MFTALLYVMSNFQCHQYHSSLDYDCLFFYTDNDGDIPGIRVIHLGRADVSFLPILVKNTDMFTGYEKRYFSQNVTSSTTVYEGKVYVS